MNEADILHNIRQQVLKIVLAALAFGLWIWVLLANAYSTISMDMLLLVLSVELLCLVIYYLQQVHWRIAINLFIVLLFLLNSTLVLHFSMPLGYVMLTPLTVISLFLVDWRAAFLVGISSTALMFLPIGDTTTHFVTASTILLWIMLGLSGLLIYFYREAVQIALNYQTYAFQELEKSRIRRGELARLAHALRITQDKLLYANLQLQQSRAAAEQSRQMKARFAANVSHELRTPINLIVGFSEMLVMTPENYNAELPRAFLPDIHAIYRNAQHLQKLINDILDISQIEAGRMSIIKETVSTFSIIQDTVQLARDLIENKGLELIVKASPDLPYILADATRISQVILNLLANAARFTEQGYITLQAEQEQDLVRISVSDTGIGIPTHSIDFLFEEFYQVDSENLPDQDGTGLGLALSHQLVRLHGGCMTASSAGIPGLGSTFSFTLPTPSHSYLTPGHVRSTASLAGSNCIIIVDDDPAVIQLFKGYSSSHTVIACADLQEAEQYVTEIGPSALVVADSTDDVLLQELARLHPQMAIISCPMPSGRRIVQKYEVADYLVKPVSRNTLLTALRNLNSPLNHILIVDDNLDLCRLFTQFLNTALPETTIAQVHDGQSALKTMRIQPPDVVILDILMPGMDGFEVMHHIRQDASLSNTIIIVVSAHGAGEALMADAEGSIEISKAAGFAPIELVNCLESIVSQLK